MDQSRDCKSLLASLSDYIDGELTQDLCHEIEQHIANCPDCTIVVNTLRKTVSLYHKTAPGLKNIPVEVRSRLYKCLDLDEFINHK